MKTARELLKQWQDSDGTASQPPRLGDLFELLVALETLVVENRRRIVRLEDKLKEMEEG